MLANIARQIADSFWNKIPFAFELAPVAGALPSTKIAWPTINDILGDGRIWATPKRQRNIFERWQRKYGDVIYKDAIKFIQPKRNIKTCLECGEFHEAHTICRHCYAKIEKESKSIIESIENNWGRQPVDKEVQVLYQGENGNNLTNHKRTVELERPRPLWFTSNLSQKSTQIQNQIEGLPAEQQNRTVRFKDEDKSQ